MTNTHKIPTFLKNEAIHTLHRDSPITSKIHNNNTI